MYKGDLVTGGSKGIEGGLSKFLLCQVVEGIGRCFAYTSIIAPGGNVYDEGKDVAGRLEAPADPGEACVSGRQS